MFNYLLSASVEATPSLSDTVDLIEKSGVETVLSAVVVITLLSGLGIFFWWLKRKLSGDYIHKDKALEYVKESQPEKLKPDIRDLSDLRDHDAFDMWAREIRFADSMEIRDKQGNVDRFKTDVARDIIQWTIRANRNAFKRILDEAYNLVDKDPDTFEEYFGDAKSFQHKVNNALTQIKTAISYKLRDDLEMPDIVVNSFDQYRAEVHETMRDMLQIAVTNHTNSYWRMHEVLNSQYAFTRTLRISVFNFLIMANDSFEGLEYHSSSESTLPSYKINKDYTPNSASSIFDYQ